MKQGTKRQRIAKLYYVIERASDREIATCYGFNRQEIIDLLYRERLIGRRGDSWKLPRLYQVQIIAEQEL